MTFALLQVAEHPDNLASRNDVFDPGRQFIQRKWFGQNVHAGCQVTTADRRADSSSAANTLGLTG
jgi:hypothetical protein